ncbi:hypothetical protein BN946_scf184988.g13 [Trametes cinnabarina]|uniref:Uncharacterized protein n=1 Tax=Pycnoporus cinnabarinus TaxID=5643 RepID=A0A060SL65_PYCCI|nr:hypothetical protein BN946_scf184988.g13 [Trametes cinnabarina]
MRIVPHRKARQVDDGQNLPSISGFGGVSTVVPAPVSSAPLVLNTAAPTLSGPLSAPPLAGSAALTLPPSSTTSSTSAPSSSDSAESSSAASKHSQIPLGAVIGACVGAFVVVVVIICFCYAWFKRSTDKLSAAQRRNAESEAEQQRAHQKKTFNRLDSPEKPARGGDLPPPSSGTRDFKESDEKNFSMFKKSPSVRTAYTTKTTTDEDQVTDLPQLDFTKYHPTLAQELALEKPDKPFAAGRQNSGVSWDGETLGDDSFLSLRSMRMDSGTMSPTMVMAKMTPPATTSAIHKWESAEVLTIEEAAAQASSAPAPEPAPEPQSRNPFAAEMAEERRARNNPFFNAQDMNRTSKVIRSRSNSRTSRTSRAQSLVRSESRATQHTITQQNTNPFLDLQDAIPLSSIASTTPDMLTPNSGLPNKPSVPSGSSAEAFSNQHAMASLIAALELPKEEIEERLRVVSMQGSLVSAYSDNDESDIATVREFPLPPGASAPSP